jgi:threonylcarbamoyladenosine tRNA methylthiotransferase MtaB
MPQLDRGLIKQRARRLREAGDAALGRHLAAQVGVSRRVLAESAALGRTEQFIPVRLKAPVCPGEIFDVRIAGYEAGQLLAA